MATKLVKNLKLGDSVVTSVPATIVETVNAGNVAIVVGGTAAEPTVGVQLSPKEGNGLTIETKNGEKGLYVSKDTLDLSTVFVPKGGMTVAQSADYLAAGEIGWVYNMTTAGQVADGIEGTITVKIGDNLAIVNNGTDESPVKKWDKLSATIDVPEYTGSGVIDITNSVVSLRIKSNSGLEAVTNAGASPNVDELAVKLDGNSLAVGSGGVKVNPRPTQSGLAIDDSTNGNKGLYVNTGNGLEVTTGTGGNKVQVKAADDSISVTSGGVAVNPKTAGGLSVDTTSSSNGLQVDVDNATIKLDGNGKVALKASPTGGLDVSDSTNGVSIKTGGGLQKSGTDGTVSVKPNANKAIEVDGTNGVGVVVGSNMDFSSGALVVDIDKSSAVINDNTTISDIITLLGGTIQSVSAG